MNEFLSRELRFLLPLSLLVLLATHFLALGWMPFFGADEPRYARVGEEMVLRDNYVTPTLNFKPWLEKPPLLFWVETISFRLFGISETTARLPVALMGGLCALLSGCFLAGRATRRAGFLGFLIMVTTPLFFAYSRAASTDMPLVATYSLAMLSTYLALGQRSHWQTVGAGLFLGLALLAKGPVALILFAGSWILLGLIELPLAWSWIRLTTIMFLGVLVAAPWYWWVWVENGFDFVLTFFVNHHLARFLTTMHRHPQPFWFFAGIILLGFFPWSIFLFSNLRRQIRGLRRRGVRFENALEPFLWIWVLVPLVFFSLSSSKLAGYILPAFPALAMIVALEWERLLKGDLVTLGSMRIQAALVGAISMILAVTLVLGSALYYHQVLWGLALALPTALGGFGLHISWRRRQLHSGFLALVLAFSMVAVLAYGWVGPRLANFHSTKELVRLVEDRLSPGQPLILYRFFHHTALYYSGYHSLDEPLRDKSELLNYLAENNSQSEYFILAKLNGLIDLREEMELAEVVQRGDVYLITLCP